MNRIKRKIHRLLKRKKDGEVKSSNYIKKVIEDLSGEAIENRKISELEEFSVNYNDLIHEPQVGIDSLKRNGLLIIPDFIQEDEVKDLSEKAKKNLDKCLKKGSENEHNDYENEQFVIDRTHERFNSYSDYANYHKSVLKIRSDADKGMVDLFNYDVSFEEEAGNLREYLSSQHIIDVMSEAAGDKYYARNLNIYFNKGVKETRGFHVDSYGKGKIKAFLYLTDVTTVNKGPYCFVKETHGDERIQTLNKEFAKWSNKYRHTDAFFFDPRKAYPILGKRGTLVISDQTGIHRGYPQKEEEERIVAVMSLESQR